MAVPKSRNVRMRDATRFGFWTRTTVPPYRAVKWSPEIDSEGRERWHGRCWEEVLPSGVNREPQHFLGADVTSVPPTEPLGYAPDPAAPICGWRLQRALGYCPKQAEPGALCAHHAAEHAALSEGEDPRADNKSVDPG